MIVRLVKLTIAIDRVEDFRALFTAYHDDIAGFPGCLSVELLQDIHEPNVFVTHSHWDSEEELNAYRQSVIFGRIWPATKLLFAAPAEARSFEVKIK
ncbi:putative quinol monooxygenase [Reichenbachiella agariperforans]|uniref:putative quinol monooxygenase n=1 Tax=Reichenbachiella agariperforans TaxID=156994 RepID=UPI001C083CB4|nr:antibiotic biosynthesis monooxygenase family protein [Reichenbachiella agariperforans]MBU2912543.1 antibiotic biosynthesis monooxygenase [Reichenbachiella agariperforans]